MTYTIGPNFDIVDKLGFRFENYGVLRQFLVESLITPEVRENAQKTLNDIVELAKSKDKSLSIDEELVPNNPEVKALKTPEGKTYIIGFDIRYFNKNNTIIVTFTESAGTQELQDTVHELPLPNYFKDGQTFMTKKVLKQI